MDDSTGAYAPTKTPNLSCVRHLDTRRDLPLVRSFLDATGDHACMAIIGFIFRERLYGEPVSIVSLPEVVSGILGMYGYASVRAALTRLEAGGFVTPVSRDPYQIKAMLFKDCPAPSEKHCAWCKAVSRKTDSHHWPISRQDGGTEIVEICRPCHVEYHGIEKLRTFGPTQKLIDLMDSSGITLEMIQ